MLAPGVPGVKLIVEAGSKTSIVIFPLEISWAGMYNSPFSTVFTYPQIKKSVKTAKFTASCDSSSD